MKHDPARSAGMRFGENDLRSAMESLSYLTRQFFEARVICANPGGTCNRIVDTIRFLERNFEREGRVMDAVGYPDAARHKKEHQKLLRKLNKMKRTLVCSGYDNAMLFGLMTEWQKNHVPGFDEPLGKYLREVGVDSEAAKTAEHR